jgi:ribonuclease HI
LHPPDVGWTKTNGVGGLGLSVLGLGKRPMDPLLVITRANSTQMQLMPSMEAHAIRDGVILARDKKFQKVIIETDSLVLSKLLNNGNFKRSEIAPIYDVMELSKVFSWFPIVFI